MATSDIFMTALEAAVALGMARGHVDAGRLKDAKQAMKGYQEHLDRLSEICYVGEDEMESEHVYQPYMSWLKAVENDVKTLKGDTETGAALISFILRACPCVCEAKIKHG